jgi:hypothetical protein
MGTRCVLSVFMNYSYFDEVISSHTMNLCRLQIGNKRLKVQHKQIRPRDMQDREESPGESFDAAEGYGRGSFSSSLPPSGSNAQSNLWYDSQDAGAETTTTTAVAAAVANTTADVMANNNAGKPEDDEAGAEPQPSSPLANLGTLQSALPEVSGITPE